MIIPWARRRSGSRSLRRRGVHALKIIDGKGMTTAVGDERLRAERGQPRGRAQLIPRNRRKAGYRTGSQVAIGLDCAASRFYKGRQVPPRGRGGLTLSAPGGPTSPPPGSTSTPSSRSRTACTGRLGRLESTSPSASAKVQLVGDDLFVTNTWILKGRHRQGHRQLDPHQDQPDRHALETFAAIRMAKTASYTAVISHRSGETETAPSPTSPVGTERQPDQTGSMSRSDRIAKYNQLLRRGRPQRRRQPLPRGLLQPALRPAPCTLVTIALLALLALVHAELWFSRAMPRVIDSRATRQAEEAQRGGQAAQCAAARRSERPGRKAWRWSRGASTSAWVNRRDLRADLAGQTLSAPRRFRDGVAAAVAAAAVRARLHAVGFAGQLVGADRARAVAGDGGAEHARQPARLAAGDRPLAACFPGVLGPALQRSPSLQIFFAIVALWGWWQWLRGTMDDGGRLRMMRSLPPRHAAFACPRRAGAGLAGAGAVPAPLHRFDVPWFDAFPRRRQPGRPVAAGPQIASRTGRPGWGSTWSARRPVRVQGPVADGAALRAVRTALDRLARLAAPGRFQPWRIHHRPCSVPRHHEPRFANELGTAGGAQ